jgi:hypothetical protein
MWYFVTVRRGGVTYYVTSPAWGRFQLDTVRLKSTYLWETEADARADERWQNLLQSEDAVRYNRTYKH